MKKLLIYLTPAYPVNKIAVLVSVIPVIFALTVYDRIDDTANTHISGLNGIEVAKPIFAFIICCLSVIWYHLSMLFSKAVSGYVGDKFRSSVAVLSIITLNILSILLVLANFSN